MVTNRSNGGIIAGSILILVGLLALLGQFFSGAGFWGSFWPFIIIGLGALFFLGMFLGGKPAAGLAIPGSIIVSIGLMMFLQNLADYWESWSYSWTLILIAIGLGIFIMGAWSGNPGPRRAGLKVMKVGAVMFILFGSFFELIFSSSRPGGLGQWLFPAALILLGGYLVVERSGLLRGRSEEPQERPEDGSQGL